MGIFQKFSTLLKSNINDLIARAENPEKMLNQIILDMRDQLAKAKREVAAAIADERKLRAQLDDEIKQTRDWEHRAMLAVKEGRDDLAKQALIRQQEHAQRATTLEQTWTAQAQRRIHETMSGLSDTSAFEAFNRMAEKIEESERRSLAQAEVAEALSGDSLEHEFLQLESGGEAGDVEDRLLALKHEMGLIAAPGSEKPKALGAGDEPEAEEEAAGETEEAEEEGVEAQAEPQDDQSPVADAVLLEEFQQLEKKEKAE